MVQTCLLGGFVVLLKEKCVDVLLLSCCRFWRIGFHDFYGGWGGWGRVNWRKYIPCMRKGTNKLCFWALWHMSCPYILVEASGVLCLSYPHWLESLKFHACHVETWLCRQESTKFGHLLLLGQCDIVKGDPWMHGPKKALCVPVTFGIS